MPRTRADPDELRVIRRHLLPLAVAGAAALLSVTPAAAGGPAVTFDGGTPTEQAQVRGALQASSFDWSLLPQPIAVHIGATGSFAMPGNIYLNAGLLDAGQLSWGVVLHEFGHEVDFLLLTDADRAQLQAALGAKDWCYETAGLQHSDHGCERFASELSWAYWPSAGNVLRPTGPGGESSGMPAADFRALVDHMLNAPTRALTDARRRTGRR